MRISDWSSDVCSSDLQHALEVLSGGGRLRGGGTVLVAGHAGQDVVAGAVEDAVDAVDAVGGEALAQALDDGNAAGHRGLVADGAADALGQSGKRGAAVREPRLVGGDNIAPGEQRGLHDLPCGVQVGRANV